MHGRFFISIKKCKHDYVWTSDHIWCLVDHSHKWPKPKFTTFIRIRSACTNKDRDCVIADVSSVTTFFIEFARNYITNHTIWWFAASRGWSILLYVISYLLFDGQHDCVATVVNIFDVLYIGMATWLFFDRISIHSSFQSFGTFVAKKYFSYGVLQMSKLLWKRYGLLNASSTSFSGRAIFNKAKWSFSAQLDGPCFT